MGDELRRLGKSGAGGADEKYGRIFPTLVAALDRTPSEVKSAAAITLGESQDAGALPHLLNHALPPSLMEDLRSRETSQYSEVRSEIDCKVREAVAEALGHIQAPASVDILEAMFYGNQEQEVKRKVVSSLGAIARSTARRGSAEARAQAADLLAHISRSKDVSRILRESALLELGKRE